MLVLEVLGIITITIIGYFIPRVVVPILLAIILVYILEFSPLIWIIFIILAIIGFGNDMDFWDKA